MANETPTPMDNKELPMIKYLKDIKAASERTGDLVKNESTANSIIASALPEVLNDTRLYYARETLDTRQGLFEIDDYLRAMLLQDAKYYGGYTQAEVKPEAGAPLQRLGIDKAPPIITSAVLLDAKTHLANIISSPALVLVHHHYHILLFYANIYSIE